MNILVHFIHKKCNSLFITATILRANDQGNLGTSKNAIIDDFVQYQK